MSEAHGSLQEKLLHTSTCQGYHDAEAPHGLLDRLTSKHASKATWQNVTAALLSLQLGWGLWLFPADFARLGWLPAPAIIILLASLTAYSSVLFTRLYSAVPGTVLFSDVGHAAAGRWGSNLVSLIVYSLDATRCVILHLAATQSLRHMWLPGPDQPTLWQCGLAVMVVSCLLSQLRSMTEMTWVFVSGTAAQLVAVVIVLAELIFHPNPDAKTETCAVTTPDTWAPAAVACMNMIFAFGGQFAFIEVMGTMSKPQDFPKAATVCTAVMACLYAGLGVVGYWSRGAGVEDIVVFALPPSRRSQLAAGCILAQALAQYLININVWVHNLLVLGARFRKTGRADDIPQPTISTDHCRWLWLGTSSFVVVYSCVISVSLPFFATLVGLVTSVTYLACAYTLPAWFALKLMGARLGGFEKCLLIAIIPASVCVSAIGLWGSIIALISDVGGGEGWGNTILAAWGLQLS